MMMPELEWISDLYSSNVARNVSDNVPCSTASSVLHIM